METVDISSVLDTITRDNNCIALYSYFFDMYGNKKYNKEFCYCNNISELCNNIILYFNMISNDHMFEIEYMAHNKACIIIDEHIYVIIRNWTNFIINFAEIESDIKSSLIQYGYKEYINEHV